MTSYHEPLITPDDPELIRHLHRAIDAIADVAGWSDAERAAQHEQLDNPPPQPEVGSDEWVQQQAELHLAIEAAEAHNREVLARLDAEARDPSRPENQPGYVGTYAGRPVFRDPHAVPPRRREQ